MLNILQRKMWCWTFYKVKCTRCQNAFDAKMHFGNASNAFLHQMHFCTASNVAEHFPLENVRQNAFCRFLTFCKQNVRVASNAFDAKMHLMRCQNAFWHQMHFCNATHQMHFCIKCIFAQLNIFLWKMYAEHFPLENVRIKCIFAQPKCILASNAFVTFCFAEHFPLENVMPKCIFAQPKCILASNAFLHSLCFLQSKKHSILPLSNILVCWTFSFGKCDAEHFPLEMYVAKMHFCKMHFCNAFILAQLTCTPKCIAVCKNAFDAKMHFCNAPTKCKGSIKCIFASNAFVTFCWCWTFSKGKCSAPTKCTHLCFLQSKKHSIFATHPTPSISFGTNLFILFD